MIEVGKVLKPHGIKGEIKLEPYTLDEKFWKNAKTLAIGDKDYEIEYCKFYKNFVYIKPKDVSSMDEAETFRGKTVYGNKNNLNLSQDEYLVEDLEGCTLLDEEGKLIGFVDSVEKYSSTSIINVLLGGAVHSFPFLEKIIKSIDIENKQIVVFRNLLDEVLV